MAPKPKAISRLSGASGDFVVEDSVKLARENDGTTLTVTFKTAFDVSCQLSYYARDTVPLPAPASLTWKNCVSSQPGKSFQESIQGLKPDVLNVVAIRMWPKESTPENGVVRLFNEETLPDIATFSVLRIDTQTLSGISEAIKLTMTPEAALQKLLAPAPCLLSSSETTAMLSVGDPLASPINTRVSTKGYITGSTLALLDSSGVRPFQGTAFQPDAKEWTLSAQKSTSVETLTLKNPLSIESVSLKQGSKTYALTNKGLEESNDETMSLVLSEDATVQWKLKPGVAETSAVVTVSLISKANAAQTTTTAVCRFAAGAGEGILPKDILSKLNAAMTSVHVSVETVELLPKERWIIRSTDWRSRTARW